MTKKTPRQKRTDALIAFVVSLTESRYSGAKVAQTSMPKVVHAMMYSQTIAVWRPSMPSSFQVRSSGAQSALNSGNTMNTNSGMSRMPAVMYTNAMVTRTPMTLMRYMTPMTPSPMRIGKVMEIGPSWITQSSFGNHCAWMSAPVTAP